MRYSPFSMLFFVALILTLAPTSVHGQAETPDHPDAPIMAASEAVLTPLTDIQSIAAGGSHTCALTEAGGVKCWGYDVDGEVGDGADDADKLTPVDVVGLTSGVKAIAAGGSHTCAITDTNGVKCWGSDEYGQVGDGVGNADKLTPVDVVGLTSGVKAVAAGRYHTCALTEAGGVKCWGYDDYGQVGDGAGNADKLAPVDVVGLSGGVDAIAAGGYHTCALTTGGGVLCWGLDNDGQIGDGADSANKLTPVNVVGLTSGVKAIAAGGSHTCAITDTGGVKCWGNDGDGGVGDGSDNTDKETPVNVVGLTSGAKAITAGEYHTCALTDAGGLHCWGNDDFGQVGDGADNNEKTTPVNVTGLADDVATVAAGSLFTCALTTNGDAKCWGRDSQGQVGDGDYATNKLVPVNVIEPATCYELTHSHSGQGTSPVADPERTAGCPVDHYLPGQNIALYADADNNWRVNGWTGTAYNGSLNQVNNLIMPASDTTVSVAYGVCRALTVGHSGSGGDPEPYPANSLNCAPGSYVQGETIALIAKPNADQRVKQWTGADTTPDTGALVNTLTMPNSTHTVQAAYEACNVLTAQVNGMGEPLTAVPVASAGCAAGSYASGQSIMLTAAPASGWTVAGWSGTAADGSSTATNSVIMPNGDHTVGVTYSELDEEEPEPEPTGDIYLPGVHG